MQRRLAVMIAICVTLSGFTVYRKLLPPTPVFAQVESAPVSFRPDDYEPHTVVPAFPPIVDPPHVSAADGDRQLSPNELVLGVELDGMARAFPLNMLTGPSREIFNDRLGQTRIAATW